jgi:hypothetical protein
MSYVLSDEFPNILNIFYKYLNIFSVKFFFCRKILRRLNLIKKCSRFKIYFSYNKQLPSSFV